MMSDLFYELPSGPCAGQVRQCLIVKKNGDGTVNLTVFTDKHDGLDSVGLYRPSNVSADYVSTTEDGAKENAAKWREAEAVRIAQENVRKAEEADRSRKELADLEEQLADAQRRAQKAEADRILASESADELARKRAAMTGTVKTAPPVPATPAEPASLDAGQSAAQRTRRTRK